MKTHETSNPLKTIVKDYEIVAALPPRGNHTDGSSFALKPIIGYIYDDKTKARQILDIGFGFGGLGKFVKTNPETAHWSVDGVDGYFPTCCNTELFDKKYYRNIWHGLASDIPAEQLRAYDIVCLFDVIEHLEPDAAKKLLIKLLDSLNQDSYLVLSTPLWFMPQAQQDEGDLEEHKFGMPGTSMLQLLPTIYHISKENLIGTFVFAKRSLEFIDHFTPITNPGFDLEAGIQNLSSVGIQADDVLRSIVSHELR